MPYFKRKGETGRLLVNKTHLQHPTTTPPPPRQGDKSLNLEVTRDKGARLNEWLQGIAGPSSLKKTVRHGRKLITLLILFVVLYEFGNQQL